MKRVTILVDDIGESDFDGELLLYGARPWRPGPATCIAINRVISIEDHVEPLPTEPGARFWGRLGDAEPQWWFVRTIRSSIYYVPARDESAVCIDEAQRARLVRLPDPKPTEAADR